MDSNARLPWQVSNPSVQATCCGLVLEWRAMAEQLNINIELQSMLAQCLNKCCINVNAFEIDKNGTLTVQ
jgi:hypothetical protein